MLWSTIICSVVFAGIATTAAFCMYSFNVKDIAEYGAWSNIYGSAMLGGALGGVFGMFFGSIMDALRVMGGQPKK